MLDTQVAVIFFREDVEKIEGKLLDITEAGIVLAVPKAGVRNGETRFYLCEGYMKSERSQGTL